jgi:hypothetical protein
MNNGFIYPFFDSLIRLLYYCNLVEFFKLLARLCVVVLHKRSSGELSTQALIRSCNIAIDTYQIFKFSVLFLLWTCEVSSVFSKLLVYYLLFSNLFTYFYYHVWGSKYDQRVDRDTLNRKFLNSLLAIAYYLLCYAYLYQIHYNQMIVWPDNLIDMTNSIFLSVANAFTLIYGGFSPLTQEVRVVFMSELINTFLFLTIIITNSIPNHAGKENQ